MKRCECKMHQSCTRKPPRAEYECPWCGKGFCPHCFMRCPHPCDGLAPAEPVAEREPEREPVPV